MNPRSTARSGAPTSSSLFSTDAFTSGRQAPASSSQSRPRPSGESQNRDNQNRDNQNRDRRSAGSTGGPRTGSAQPARDGDAPARSRRSRSRRGGSGAHQPNTKRRRVRRPRVPPLRVPPTSGRPPTPAPRPARHPAPTRRCSSPPRSTRRPRPSASTSSASRSRCSPRCGQLGAERPFPIQAATLRATLAGRDVLGRGRTGSGKTIAFAIPLVARLTGGRRTPHRPRGLVLLPTRELALQVARTIEPLAKAAGLRTTVIFGGVGQGPQVSALRSGVDIVIACPGPPRGPDRPGRRSTCPTSRSPCSTRPTTWPTSVSCPASAGCSGPPGRRPAAAVLRDAGQRHLGAGQRLPDQPGRARGRRARTRRSKR